MVPGGFPAQRVLAGVERIRKGDILIFTRAGGGGHIEIAAQDWKGLEGPSIGGNTSSGRKGSQWNGDGVYVRWRKIVPYATFRIVYIVRPRYT